MNTHTKGPWFAVKSEFYWEVKTGPRSYDSGIGDACSSKHLEAGDNGEANARLMAAAPDLLEALQECDDYFDQRADAEYFPDSAQPVPNEEMRMLTMIRDVLGKAGA